jgi:hypothetical protein
MLESADQLKRRLDDLHKARSEHFAAQLELDSQINETIKQLQEVYQGDFPVKRYGKVIIDRAMPDYPYPLWWGQVPATIIAFFEDGDILVSSIGGCTTFPRQYLLKIE